MDSGKFLFIVGNKGQVPGEGVGGDKKIKRTDGFFLFFQAGTDGAVGFCNIFIIRQNFKRKQKFIQTGLIFGGAAAFCNSILPPAGIVSGG